MNFERTRLDKVNFNLSNDLHARQKLLEEQEERAIEVKAKLQHMHDLEALVEKLT